MTTGFKEISVCDIQDNPFKLIADDWMLVTAGNLQKFNTMTASWGTLGELWNKKVAFCFVRPTRHTYQFMEAADTFTLTFFDEKYREALDFCGSHSGRKVDKIAKTGLTPIEWEKQAVYFEQARLVLICKKVYMHDLDPKHFLDPEIDDNYPKKDYHRMYIGEIVHCFVKL
ncbi:MAG: flavin reductase family protein [Candidatus Zixiibacteriota bacterium]|nr:MAG: flavin reductase family protein [candidate division Zixibacteria bacterium]